DVKAPTCQAATEPASLPRLGHGLRVAQVLCRLDEPLDVFLCDLPALVGLHDAAEGPVHSLLQRGGAERAARLLQDLVIDIDQSFGHLRPPYISMITRISQVSGARLDVP